MADLKPNVDWYQTSRPLWDVLVGSDSALPLVEALRDAIALTSLLEQPQWTDVAHERPHCIISEDRPSQNPSDVRQVMAMPLSNLERLITKAAFDGHAASISTLLRFAAQHGIEAASVINRSSMEKAIYDGNMAVVETLVTGQPEVANMPLPHGKQPLDMAVQRGRTEIVTTLLKHGADPSSEAIGTSRSESHTSSLLSQSVRRGSVRLTETLLKHGVPIARSGALHHAAEDRSLEIMRCLIRHGADVEERLPTDTMLITPELQKTWTPMHFAAADGEYPCIRIWHCTWILC